MGKLSTVGSDVFTGLEESAKSDIAAAGAEQSGRNAERNVGSSVPLKNPRA